MYSFEEQTLAEENVKVLLNDASKTNIAASAYVSSFIPIEMKNVGEYEVFEVTSNYYPRKATLTYEIKPLLLSLYNVTFADGDYIYDGGAYTTPENAVAWQGRSIEGTWSMFDAEIPDPYIADFELEPNDNVKVGTPLIHNFTDAPLMATVLPGV